MTTTSDRIAAAIASILDEDRRADRERIAELERDMAALRALNLEVMASHLAVVDELHGKCARITAERDEIAADHRHMRQQMSQQLALIERDLVEASQK